MTQDLGSLRARLLMDSQNFSRGMRQARDEMKQTAISAQTVSKDFGRIQKASLGIGAAVAVGLGASVKVAANFEHAMARVKAISGATGSEFEALKAKAKELGETTQYSSSEAAEGMQYLAMAGFKVNDIVGAMPAVLNLAAAAQVDLGRSADIVSNIMTGFGLKAEDTGHAVDVLVKTMTTANTDLPMLGDAMKYVAPVAVSLGLGIEETAAAIAKMSDAGVQGSQAGTSLRAALLSLANPTGQTEKAMEKLGIKVTDAKGKMKPLPELIGHIGEKFKGMTEAQKTQTAAQLVGTEAVSGFLSLLSIGEDGLQDYTKELKNAGGTAERVAKTQMDTLKGSFEELKSAAEGLGIEIGDELLPLLTELVRDGAEIIRTLGLMDGANVKSALSFAGTAAAIALTISTIGKLGIAAKGLMTSMGPAGWLILGVSLLGGVFATAKMESDKFLESTLKKIDGMTEEAKTMDITIQTYDNLNTKMQLTNKEFGRYLDINNEIKNATDPKVIESLTQEQDKLREKSGLTNEEMQKFIEANDLIIEKVPESNIVLSDQGRIFLENADAAKEMNKQKYEEIRLELEIAKSAARETIKQDLEQQDQLLDNINKLQEKRLENIDKIKKQEELVGKLQAELRDAQASGDEKAIFQAEAELLTEQDQLDVMQIKHTKLLEEIQAQQDSLDKVSEKVKKLDEVNQQMIELELKMVGINAKHGEEIQAIDSTIGKLESQKQALEQNTPAAQKNSEAYRDGVEQIENQIAELKTVKSRIIDIIGQAENMNSVLGKQISKTVSIYEVIKSSGNGKDNLAHAPIYHTGGIVGQRQLNNLDTIRQKLHTGGLVGANSIGDDSEDSRNKAILTIRMIEKLAKDGVNIA